MALNKQEFKAWCQELADKINEQIADMEPEEAQRYLDILSQSFFVENSLG